MALDSTVITWMSHGCGENLANAILPWSQFVSSFVGDVTIQRPALCTDSEGGYSRQYSQNTSYKARAAISRHLSSFKYASVILYGPLASFISFKVPASLCLPTNRPELFNLLCLKAHCTSVTMKDTVSVYDSDISCMAMGDGFFVYTNN